MMWPDGAFGLVAGQALMLAPGAALFVIVFPLALLVRLVRVGPRAFREEMGLASRTARGR